MINLFRKNGGRRSWVGLFLFLLFVRKWLTSMVISWGQKSGSGILYIICGREVKKTEVVGHRPKNCSHYLREEVVAELF